MFYYKYKYSFLSLIDSPYGRGVKKVLKVRLNRDLDNMNQIETHLVRKQSNFPSVCVFCGDQMLSMDTYYVEVGYKEHIHSLIARKFCEDCYMKYGEQMLLKGKKQ